VIKFGHQAAAIVARAQALFGRTVDLARAPPAPAKRGSSWRIGKLMSTGTAPSPALDSEID